MTRSNARLTSVLLMMLVSIWPCFAQLPRVGGVIDRNERDYFGFRSRGPDPDRYVVELGDSLVLFGYGPGDSVSAIDTVSYSPRQTQLVIAYLQRYEQMALAKTPWYRVDTAYTRMAQTLSITLEYPRSSTTIACAVGSTIVQGIVLARYSGGLVIGSIPVDSAVLNIQRRPYQIVRCSDIDSLSIVDDGEIKGWIPTERRADRTNGILDYFNIDVVYTAAVPPEVVEDASGIVAHTPTELVVVPNLIERVKAWRVEASFSIPLILIAPVVYVDVVGNSHDPPPVTSQNSNKTTRMYLAQVSLNKPLNEQFDVGISGIALFEEPSTADTADVGVAGFDSYGADVHAVMYLGKTDKYGYQRIGLTASAGLGMAFTTLRWWTSYYANPKSERNWDSHTYQYLQMLFSTDARLWWWPNTVFGVFLQGQIAARFLGSADPHSVSFIDYNQFYTMERVLESTTSVTVAAILGIAVNL